MKPVDIADPRSDAEPSLSTALDSVMVHDRAIATSGNYRRGFEIGGRHYSHIVDPRTGNRRYRDQLHGDREQPDDAGRACHGFLRDEARRKPLLAASIPGVEFLLVKNNGERVRARAGDPRCPPRRCWPLLPVPGIR